MKFRFLQLRLLVVRVDLNTEVRCSQRHVTEPYASGSGTDCYGGTL